ncbi:hypothetical protein [Hymenobacter edaphi]|uniref:Uncharacterized protein n=1 Tax=Hymenobacter edaphi TaxID=2211146 RepID=A0A328BD55_9BACT|nr:hypothetical protein [Hymenobacter edaphi]RAK64679.1 hypothetical protein DLM85_18525 [Hymenobacter edaphi]
MQQLIISLLGGGLLVLPLGTAAQPPAADPMRGRFLVKADALRPGLIALASAEDAFHGAFPVRLHWLVSGQYYFSARRSLQLDWLHRGGRWPRLVEGFTLQYRFHELAFDEENRRPGSLYWAPLLGYRRLSWPTELPTVDGRHPRADRVNAGGMGGVEVALTKRRPQLTLDMSLGTSYQFFVWKNRAFAETKLYHLDRKSSLAAAPVNLDARLALGLCF